MRNHLSQTTPHEAFLENVGRFLRWYRACNGLLLLVGLACIGYTWGWLSSVALGRHYGRVRRSAKPKLFLQGERDEFTAPELLHSTARRMDDCEKCIFKGVGHFDLEHSSWDAEVVRVIRAWVGERFLDEGSAPRDEAGQLVCMDAAEHAARGRA